MTGDLYESTSQLERCRKCGEMTVSFEISPGLESHICTECHYNYLLIHHDIRRHDVNRYDIYRVRIKERKEESCRKCDNPTIMAIPKPDLEFHWCTMCGYRYHVLHEEGQEWI